MADVQSAWIAAQVSVDNYYIIRKKVYNLYMSDIILCNISDCKKVVDEARLDWTINILYYLGVPEEFLDFKNDIREFRNNMDKLGIEVDVIGGELVNIYKKRQYEDEYGNSGWLPSKEQDLVAQWKEPVYIRKIENKKIYYEIHTNEWSIFNMREI